MKAIHNRSINAIVAGALLLCALMVAAIVGLHVVTTQKADKSFSQIIALNAQLVTPISHAKDLLNTVRFQVNSTAYTMAQRPDAEPDKKALAEIEALITEINATVDGFVKTAKGTPEEAVVTKLGKSFDAAMNFLTSQYRALKSGSTMMYNATRRASRMASEHLSQTYAGYMAHAGQVSEKIVSNHDGNVQRSAYGMIAAVVITAILFLLIYLTLRSLVIKPLANAGKQLNRIAEADLSHRIDVPGRNEIGRLFAAMQHMQKNLGDIVGQVRGGINSIHTGASEISRGNMDLSSRTEEQAASVQETASSMEEITATVQHNAENARQATTLANDASGTASHGGEIMAQVTGTMQGISESSEKVTEIIEMIDSIAFQTNILALNASVEAARAGEQGRGFAVVADEVRNLAARSASAAQDIRQLIESSNQQIREGSTQVGQASETMSEVVAAVKRVTDIIDEISTASQEQSSGLTQISQAVSQVDTVTQKNAALVEEIAATSQSLESQAEQMNAAVDIFRLADADHPEALAALDRAPADESQPAAHVSAQLPAPDGSDRTGMAFG